MILHVVLWLVLVAAVGLSAVYSAAETGIYVLNKIRLELHAESGSRGARRLRDLLKDPNGLLVALLVGVNLAEYTGAFAVSTMLLLTGVQEAEWYTLAIVTPLMFILGESVPKNISQRLGERMMYPLSSLLRGSVIVLKVTGLSLVVQGISWLTARAIGVKPKRSPLGHEAFSAIMAEGQASGVLTHLQSVMADRIMHIQEVRLADVMIPMARVVAAPQDVSREQLLELMRHHEYSRLPLMDATGAVAGVLDVYDVFNSPPETSPKAMMTEPLLLPPDMIVTDALYQMQRTRKMMGIVIGLDGKPAGVVTVKDIVEEIVGELEAW